MNADKFVLCLLLVPLLLVLLLVIEARPRSAAAVCCVAAVWWLQATKVVIACCCCRGNRPVLPPVPAVLHPSTPAMVNGSDERYFSLPVDQSKTLGEMGMIGRSG